MALVEAWRSLPTDIAVAVFMVALGLVFLVLIQALYITHIQGTMRDEQSLAWQKVKAANERADQAAKVAAEVKDQMWSATHPPTRAAREKIARRLKEAKRRGLF